MRLTRGIVKKMKISVLTTDGHIATYLIVPDEHSWKYRAVSITGGEEYLGTMKMLQTTDGLKIEFSGERREK